MTKYTVQLLLNNPFEDGFDIGVSFKKMVDEDDEYNCSLLTLGFLIVSLQIWINDKEQDTQAL